MDLSAGISNSRNPTEFWRVLNKYMRTRKPRENPIDVSRWEEHFKSFFNIPRFYNTRFAGDLIDPNLDFEVSVGELNLVLRNCRENKAPVIKYLPEVVK